jgi:hypothetical protein
MSIQLRVATSLMLAAVLAAAAQAQRSRSDPGFRPDPNRQIAVDSSPRPPGILAGGDTCASPPTVVSALPFVDAGDTCPFANDISSYTGTCTLPFPYPGEDVIYQINTAAGNSVAFSMSLTGSTGDLALFVLNTCGSGPTCTANSQDAIGPGVGPEVISARAYQSSPVFLYIDSYYGTADPRGCGTYTLNVTGNLPAELIELTVD